MSLIEYSGVLGKFTYDDTQFKLTEPNLVYIGEELDGTKITIPIGIKYCNHMFYNTNIKSMPEIPSTVLSCILMFGNCKALLHTTKIPDGVIYADYMFVNCTNLTEYVYPLPRNLEEANSMFLGCESLKKVYPILPNKLREANRMFASCSNLTTEIKYLPKTLETMTEMFMDCKALNRGIMHQKDFQYLDKYKTTDTYKGCTSLTPMYFPKTNAKGLLKASINFNCMDILLNTLASLLSLNEFECVEQYFCNLLIRKGD